MAEAYDWGKLNHLQLGRYAEYFVKMEFTRHGFDVYSAEVDGKGIDLVVRTEQRDGGTRSLLTILRRQVSVEVHLCELAFLAPNPEGRDLVATLRLSFRFYQGGINFRILNFTGNE